jgi:hypothetical protein
LEAARTNAEEPEERVVFMPALEISASETESADTATASSPVRQGSMVSGFPLIGLFGLLSLMLGGLFGYRLRERQLRKRLGGLSL